MPRSCALRNFPRQRATSVKLMRFAGEVVFRAGGRCHTLRLGHYGLWHGSSVGPSRSARRSTSG
eukprot:1121674-Alexandrium_andersonii.AAC.1